jgi:hypothetical protein
MSAAFSTPVFTFIAAVTWRLALKLMLENGRRRGLAFAFFRLDAGPDAA